MEDIDWVILLPAVVALITAALNVIAERSASAMGKIFKSHIEASGTAVRDVAQQMRALQETINIRDASTIQVMKDMHRDAMGEMRRMANDLADRWNPGDATIDVRD